MKAKEAVRTTTIRMIRGQMKDFQIAKGAPLTPEDEISVLNNAAKKRKEAIEIYEKSNRPDLLAKEKEELAVIAGYLPEQISAAEVEQIVTRVIPGSRRRICERFGQSDARRDGPTEGQGRWQISAGDSAQKTDLRFFLPVSII